jgi:signal peptide peptidase SppA
MSQISGGTSIDKLTAQFRQALSDRSVSSIVFDIDSPGGGVGGVPELADEIYGSRSQKKTIAVANGMAGSAAYWLGASASEMVVVPSGEVGSIGVFCAHEDLSKAIEAEGVKISLISAGKFKVDGNPYEALSDSARADMQSRVEAYYSMFANTVARGRRASQREVRDGFGQGRMVLAAQAVKCGMVDRVATMDDTLARLTGTAVAGENKRLDASTPMKSLALRRMDLDLLRVGDESAESDRAATDPAPRPVESMVELDRRRRELDRH